MDALTVNSLLNTVSAVVIGATIIICSAWIINSIVAAMRQRANTRTRAEVYNKLIDKFGTAPEFVQFLTSDAGLRFIEEQAIDTSQPLGKILGSVRLGVTFTLVGLGMLFVSNVWDRELGQDLYVVVALGGTVGLTAGVGFIIAAAISYMLCRNLGLIQRPAGNRSKVDDSD
ncbi:MAG TPA: hypothetical protein VNA22_00575 [Pyrinomonadaceae bacterium]|nr:hypothetical protein [Pyrinomonadaceae bacterium]